MNIKQRIVLFSTAVILALMLLFPPFYGVLPGKLIENTRYNFILTPSKFTYPDPEMPTRIDSATLLTQYLFIITISGILYFAFKEKE